MKAIHRLVLAVAVFGVITVQRSYALPPTPHSIRGVVETVNSTNHSFVLRNKDGAQSFYWKDFTTFKLGGDKATADAVKPGSEAKVSYRREMGQRVPRSVKIQRPPVQ